MSPALSIPNKADKGGRDAELLAERLAGERALIGPESADLVIGEFTAPVVHSTAVSLAALPVPVPVVVEMSPEPEMGGVAAGRVVAGVTDKKAIWNLALGQLIGDPVGGANTAPSGSSVSSSAKGALPFPTLGVAADIHATPEPVFRKVHMAQYRSAGAL